MLTSPYLSPQSRPKCGWRLFPVTSAQSFRRCRFLFFHSTPFTVSNLLGGELMGERRILLVSSPAGSRPGVPHKIHTRRSTMPTAKELNIQLEHKPGRLAKLCKALADRKVNIVAFQASTDERRSQVHLIVDNATAA